ncbi:amino acid adenylation domain-containing protein [Thermoflavimicrobium daqui]|nr:non-ribosomal peptide synthetase [Thermoflavimicrobium daqui]
MKESLSTECYVFPTSFAQERLWFVQETLSDPSVYHVPILYKMQGSIRVDLLQQSINKIVERHESLRTCFAIENNEMVQVIYSESDCPLQQIQMPGLIQASESIPAEVQEWVEKEMRIPFSLQEGPLLRCYLISCSDYEHYLFLNMHHIITDGWSVHLFMKELTTLYEAALEGTDAILPELPIQMADYTQWQRELLQGEYLEEQLAYWQKNLKGELPVLRLPKARPRSSIVNHKGSSYSFHIPLETSQRFTKLCQERGITLYIGLLAVYKVLLTRYSGQTDIVVGTPIAGRNSREVENLIGLFVNTLVIRNHLADNPSFTEFMQQVKKACLEAYDHQDLPFEVLVEKLNPGRSLNHSPLFQAMFAFQNTPEITFELPEVQIIPVDLETGTAKFEIYLSVEETTDGLYGVFEYQTDLYDLEMIQQLAMHFNVLLEQIVQDPDLKVMSIPLLSEEEKAQILQLSSSHLLEGEQELDCCHQLFSAQVDRTPDAIAVSYNDGSLTYSELNRKANQWAHYLQKKGVSSGTLVGLCVDRSLESVIGVLAILKAGGAYVPLDPTYPEEKISKIVEDAQINMVLTQEKCIRCLPDSVETIVCFDRDDDWTQLEPEEDPSVNVYSESIAYILYRSDSMGKPKGIVFSHGSITQTLHSIRNWMNEKYSINEKQQDIWTLFYSLDHAYSILEIWGALLQGDKLVIVPRWITRSSKYYYELLIREKVTILIHTIPVFHTLLKAGEKREYRLIPQLRLVLLGGEAGELSILSSWMERQAEQLPQILYMYGLTEVNGPITCLSALKEGEWRAQNNRMGAPLSGVEVYILDTYQQPVPIGVPGEIYIGGPRLAKGYLNPTDEAMDCFISHPFQSDTSAHLYRTGIVGRYLSNHELEYLGRLRKQATIEGYQFSLEEIENVFIQHAHVKDTVVLAKQDEQNHPCIVGYVATDTEHHVQSSALRQFLSTKIPEYMIPQSIVVMESFALKSSGEVDLDSLPDPFKKENKNTAYVPPRNEIEKKLAEIWSKVLQIPQVGIDDNYFVLGGDSIRILPIVSMAKEQNIDFQVKDLFSYQTIRTLASQVQIVQQDEENAITPFSLISQEDRENIPDGVVDAYPLTQLQRGMLFHSELHPSSRLYIDIFRFSIRGSYRLEVWQKALERLMDRHPILRTTFDLTNYSEPLQLVHNHQETPIFYHDLRHLDWDEQEVWLQDWFEKEKDIPFDWSQVLFRVHIHQRKDQWIHVCIAQHHSILDGWSVSYFMTELFENVDRLLAGEELEHKETLSSLFRNYVQKELQAVQSAEQEEYWKQKLSGAVYTKIPRWDSAKGKQPEMKLREISISEKTSQGLKQLAESYQIPLKSLLLALHLRVLKLLSGQSDVTTGVVFHGRLEERDGDRALGLYLNTLPFRLNLDGGSWIELAQQVLAVEQDLFPYRRYPMAEIQQKTSNGEPLFETFFNFTHFYISKQISQYKHLDIQEEQGLADTNFPFGTEFAIDVESNRVQLILRWDASIFQEKQIQLIAGYYQKAMQAMTVFPNERYETVTLISEAEQKEIQKWNQTEKRYSEKHVLHHLIEKQVARTPDDIALIYEGQHLTFQQCNQKANQLARLLSKHGVRSEVKVGVCLERSVDMVLGLLAILKAGGAYVPLDPSFPKKRIKELVEDGEITVVLTKSNWAQYFANGETHVICMDQIGDELSSEPATNLDIPVSPDQLAYMIYTSGSTGKPKGVLISHQAIVNRLLWMQEEYNLQTDDRVILKTPFTFDVSVWEFFWPLLSGAGLVIAKPEGHKDPDYLVSLIQKEQVTTIHFVPSMLHAFLEADDVGQCSSLKRVICSGEALSIELQKRFFERLSCQLFNLYGPTEAAVDVTYWECKPNDSLSTVPIGFPISNIYIRLLDEHMRPVPVGVPGELYIGGVGLARGYHGRPELTKERFILDPFHQDQKARLYKSGDLARYLPNGAIEYLGRLDHQVKIRGFRIELGEIEAALLQHPRIRECVVHTGKDPTGNTVLIAYMVMENPADKVSIQQLHTFLEKQIPAYMIPSRWMFIDEMPLTVSGKVNRRALPRVGSEHRRSDSNDLLPRDRWEWKLFEIWRKLLGVTSLSIRDSFFHMGGNSLLAVRLMALIQKEFQQKIPLASILQHSSIEQLAQLLRKSRTKPPSSLVTLQSEGKQNPLICIHPVGGSVLSYLPLAQALGKERPLYAVQAEGLDGETAIHEEIQQMARRYIQSIRSVQPHGPYYLLGWSFGGLVAHEMACQLQQVGEQIDLLVLLDSRTPQSNGHEGELSEEEWIELFLQDFIGMNSLGLDLSTAGEQLQSNQLEQAWMQRVAHIAKQDNMPELEWEYLKRYFEVFQANLKSISKHEPQWFDGTITWFIASMEADQSTGGRRWERYAEKVTTISLNADHYSIMKSPHVEAIASHLRSILSNRADTVEISDHVK